MKIIRYINGKQKEKEDLYGLKISNELITETIAKVNKRNSYISSKGMNVSNE